MTLDDEKLALLDEAADHPEPRGRDAAVAPGPLVRPYYRNVAAEDITERTSADLFGALDSHLELARTRPQGTARVRLLTPGPDDGWSAGGHSVVEVVTDDMPFLVDSLTMELVRQDLDVRLVVHPQMDVVRDITGELQSVTGVEDGSVAPEGDAVRESWMHVEVSRVSDRGTAAEIEEALQRVLGDVRVAVEDWPKMNEQVRAIVGELDTDPPPLRGSEVTQGQDLLRWLAADHFTFLGYREYRLETIDGGGGAAGRAGHRPRDPALRPGPVVLVPEAARHGPCEGA
jgi:glutamate dehydrogenase